MANNASVTLRGGFPVGTEVGLYPRTGDFFRGGRSVQKGKVGDDGHVRFDGLEEGDRYWAAAEVDDRVRARAVTAKVQPGAKKALAAKEVRERLHATRPAMPSGQVVSGARNTVNSRATSASGAAFASKAAGVPTPKEDQEAEPLPHVRQEDARDVPQRSATVTGMATPKDPEEIVPAPAQSDVPDGTPQRSATKLGVAAPKEKGEEAAGAKQEDAADVPQRSATPDGVAEPKPTGSAVEQERAKFSAQSKARGGRMAEKAVVKTPVKTEQVPKSRARSAKQSNTTKKER